MNETVTYLTMGGETKTVSLSITRKKHEARVTYYTRRLLNGTTSIKNFHKCKLI
jgi:hypothetical protein